MTSAEVPVVPGRQRPDLHPERAGNQRTPLVCLDLFPKVGEVIVEIHSALFNLALANTCCQQVVTAYH
jgi:hypothetical protein